MELTHLDAHGAARMVDVSAKDVTARTATAAGRFVTTPEVIDLLRRDGLPKGDALAVARIAGIAGAKRTPDLVPLCHPVALHGVTVDLELADDGVEITATTRTADRTGVEMEALTSVVVAGLALYDMVKAVDRGGPAHRRPAAGEGRRPHAASGTRPARRATHVKVAVITCSNRSASGERADDSGELLAADCSRAGPRASCCAAVVPDDIARDPGRGPATRSPPARDVVLTTGGTGLTPTDVTPEAVRRCSTARSPASPRRCGWPSRDAVPTSVLSRGVAGSDRRRRWS